MTLRYDPNPRCASTLMVEAEMSGDLDDQSMHVRDELRGTKAGHDPWFGVRLMRHYEEREQRGGGHGEPPLPEKSDDDGRPR